MRKFFGVLLIIVGIAVGVYIDIWLCLIGGIEEIVSGATAQPVNGTQIAWGFVRAFVFTGIGVFVAWILVAVGAGVAGSKPRLRLRRPR